MLSRSNVIIIHSPGFSRILVDVNLQKGIDLQNLNPKKKKNSTNEYFSIITKKHPLLSVATVLQNGDLATTVKTRVISMKHKKLSKYKQVLKPLEVIKISDKLNSLSVKQKSCSTEFSTPCKRQPT